MLVVTSGVMVGVVVDETPPLGAPVDPRDGRLLGIDEDCIDGCCEGWLDGCDDEYNDGGDDVCNDGCNDGCVVGFAVIMFVSKSSATKPLLAW